MRVDGVPFSFTEQKICVVSRRVMGGCGGHAFFFMGIEGRDGVRMVCWLGSWMER